MTQPCHNENIQFLAGDGEMATLSRTKDWSKTPVGAPQTWPQSLRTTLSIILNSKFPMFLWWGDELTCFYNDAYRPSLGENGKHPYILGMPAAKAWPEIWVIIKPLIDQVLAGAGATWSEDQLVPIFRNGKIEDVYWTFSYSPVNDESGKIAGVLVTCNETTQQVITRRKLEENKNQLQFAIDAAELATWDINPATNTFTGDDRLKEWHGLAPENEFDLEEGFNVVNEKDRARVKKAIAESLSFSSGGIVDVQYSIEHPITKQRRIVRAKGKATFNEAKIANRLNGTLQDITEQVLSGKQIEESERDLRNMVLQSPIGICIIDAQTLVSEIVNDSFIEVAGKPYEAIAGKYYWDSFAEARTYYEAALQQVVEEGITFYANEVEIMLERHGREEMIFVTFVYAPLKTVDGEVKKVAIWVLENTQQVVARRKIEEADKRFRNTVNQAPVGITILRGAEYIVEMANEAYLRLVDRIENEFVGRPLFDSLPEVEDTVRVLLDEVLQTGIPFHGNEYPIPVDRYGKFELSYFDFLYYPLREDDGSISGIIVTVTDVSASVKAKHALAESEKQFRNMVIQSPIPMTIVRGAEHTIEIANTEMYKNIWRKEEHEIVGKKMLEVFPELNDQKYPELLHKVYSTGSIIREKESIAYVMGDDGMRKFYLDYEYKPLLETNQSVSGIMITVNDVTEKVMARQKIEENEERLNIVIEASQLGTWELNLKTDAITYSEKYLQIFGYKKDTALPHLHFMDRLHPDDLQIREKAFKEAMDKGILDYELRVIRDDGSIHWIEARGKVFYDEEKKPLRLIGTIRDITDKKIQQQKIIESESKFRLLSNSLEKQVHERTTELKEKNEDLEKMNKELQSFAYISSHDLQEPLRKIQTFVTRLIEKEQQNLSDDGKDKFQRIQNAARRMQVLIEDLLAYSRTTTAERKFENIHLDKIIEEVKDDLKEEIQQKHAIIEATEICEVHIIPFQFRQLLYNLISNSLKFSNAENTPLVKIQSRMAKEIELLEAKLDPGKKYCHIIISDNGIGFEPQYNEKIFEVFQRLHSKEKYTGTGIGLAIVKKIVENHNGVITAKGKINGGATFDIYIPSA